MDFLRKEAAENANKKPAQPPPPPDPPSSSFKPLLQAAQREIKKHTDGDEIEVELDESTIPSDSGWGDWIAKVGIQSLCSEYTWDFVDDQFYNQRKYEAWKAMGIKKIIMRVKDPKTVHPDDEWLVCLVDYSQGADFFYLTWYPGARTLGAGKKCWIVRDEIVLGLKIYELPSRCFYKSDWVTNFQDFDSDGFCCCSTGTFKRWLQFRHWCLVWYAEAQPGFNFQATYSPPPCNDGTPFSLHTIDHFPMMPSDVPRPVHLQYPELMSIDLPPRSDETPTVQATKPRPASLYPKKLSRPTSKWYPHGIIELKHLRVVATGGDIVLSNANVTYLWEDSTGRILYTKEYGKRFQLGVGGPEQAESWLLTLLDAGCEEGKLSSCCTIA